MRRPAGKGTFCWGGGSWFWVDPVNDLFVIGTIQRTIQRTGNARPSGMDLRTVSSKLSYDALGIPAPAEPALP